MTSPVQPPVAQRFPCPGCGAELTWDAAAAAMTCQHCGQKQAVAAPTTGPIRSIPLQDGMRLAQRGLGAVVQTIGCTECGATVHVGEGERTTKCAFCGSTQVLAQATDPSAIRPESLLPFGITRQVANERFGAWLKSLWFRPSDLSKMGKVQEMGGVYVPYWSFDAAVQSSWSAERGWYYYETETYEENDPSGNPVTKTRQVQRTRWEPASGQRHDDYRDVLVCAGKGLPADMAARFVSFDLARLVPYRPDFLAGWRAESYAVELMPAWETGQGIVAASQEKRCAGDVGGDTSRSLTVSNDFDQVAFKHVLLPVWIAAYRYKGKVFRFLVNGQTGEIVGQAPWSVPKIAALVILILAIIGGIVALAHANARPAGAPLPAPRPAAHHQGR